jgi:hypothetical protein
MATEDTALQALVTEAMFRALDEKKRDALVKSALATLVAPTSGGYGQAAESPLQKAFALGVREVANAVIAEMMNTEEIRVRVREIAAAAFEKMLTNKDNLAIEMAGAMIAALTKAYQ